MPVGAVDSLELFSFIFPLSMFTFLRPYLLFDFPYICVFASFHRVLHLVLDDPWGFFGLPPDGKWTPKGNRKSWLPTIIANALRNTNPLSVLRGFGPMGRRLIHHVRQDIRSMYDQRNPLIGEVNVPKFCVHLSLFMLLTSLISLFEAVVSTFLFALLGVVNSFLCIWFAGQISNEVRKTE